MLIHYLVCYDIRETKRLRETHKVVTSYGHPLQYSVFLCSLTPGEKVQLEAALHEVINHHVDSVLIVRLGPANESEPDSFQWLGDSTPIPLRRTIIF